MCQKCHNNLGYIVHHKTNINRTNINNPDITLSHGNLQYVCKKCHDAEHGLTRKEIPNEIKYSFDAEGNPVALAQGS